MTKRGWSISLAAILLAGLALRLGWAIHQNAAANASTIAALPDQGEYLELAGNLLRHGTLVMRDPHVPGDRVYAYRAPGYPLMVAMLGASPAAVRIAQAILDASTILAIYLLARRYWSRERALLAAAIVAINPFLIYFSGLILSETLYTALLAWGIALLGGRRAIACALLALSVLVRPGGMALPIVLVLATSINRRLLTAVGMAVLIAIVLFPWAYRNHSILGHWVWTTTNGGITLYDGWNDNATGASDQRFASSDYNFGGEYERNQLFASAALHWASSHPQQALELAAIKVARTWSPMPLSRQFGRPLYRWIGLLFSLPLDLLVLCGLLRPSGMDWRRSCKVLCVIPAIYLTGVCALTVGSLRYRIPAEPPLAILAVSGWPRPPGRHRVNPS